MLLTSGGQRKGPGKDGAESSVQGHATDKLNVKQHTRNVFMYSVTHSMHSTVTYASIHLE